MKAQRYALERKPGNGLDCPAELVAEPSFRSLSSDARLRDVLERVRANRRAR